MQGVHAVPPSGSYMPTPRGGGPVPGGYAAQQQMRLQQQQQQAHQHPALSPAQRQQPPVQDLGPQLYPQQQQQPALRPQHAPTAAPPLNQGGPMQAMQAMPMQEYGGMPAAVADGQTVMLSQRVAELTRDKHELYQEAHRLREELSGTRKQLDEALENVSVLEEGQGFLLQKHKQSVSDYHTRLKKAKEDLQQAGHQQQQHQQQMEQQQLQYAMQMQQFAAEEQQRQLQAHQQQQQQASIPLDAAHKAEMTQLLGVIEDLQKAIDEKNELIDLLSAQVSQYQRAAAEVRVLHQDASKDLDRARYDLESDRRKHAQEMHEITALSSPRSELEALRASFQERDAEREGQVAALKNELATVRHLLQLQHSMQQPQAAPRQDAPGVNTSSGSIGLGPGPLNLNASLTATPPSNNNNKAPWLDSPIVLPKRGGGGGSTAPAGAGIAGISGIGSLGEGDSSMASLAAAAGGGVYSGPGQPDLQAPPSRSYPMPQAHTGGAQQQQQQQHQHQQHQQRLSPRRTAVAGDVPEAGGGPAIFQAVQPKQSQHISPPREGLGGGGGGGGGGAGNVPILAANAMLSEHPPPRSTSILAYAAGGGSQVQTMPASSILPQRSKAIFSPPKPPEEM